MTKGEADIFLLQTDGTSYTLIGKDSDELLVTGTTSITFDGDTGSYFVASWSDGRDSESYLMKANTWDDSDSVNKTDIEYWDGDSWEKAKTGRQSGDTFDFGNVDLAIGAVNDADRTVVITNNSAETNFNTLFSAEGLQLKLPTNSLTLTAEGYINITNSTQSTSWVLYTDEEDKDGDTALGDSIDLTIGLNSESTKQPTISSYSTTNTDASSEEIGESDVFSDWTYSALATQILWDKSNTNQYELELMYHGDEVAASVYLTSSDAISNEGGESGVMSITDAEVSSKASGMNLIVVGGSAINSVAADLLGGAYRGEQFTSMTGVADGEFLIQSFNWDGNTALLVAGYNAADTTKAATYLQNYDVDTTVGKKYTGTSATEASLVVA
jgi:hypothetical protein